MSAKDAANLVPQRFIFAIAIRLRRRRLRRAHGIGGRKGTDQTLLKLLMDFAVGQQRLAGIGGMLVMRCRVEFLSHRGTSVAEITPGIYAGSTSFLGQAEASVYQEREDRQPSAGTFRLSQKSAVKPFIEVLSGRRQHVPPAWMMRQAGRYLPEYRELRAKAGGFLDMCFTPEYAAEVTLQPIRRFNFDAAIIFSDILVIPYALGRAVRFEAGEGPRLDPLDTPEQVATLARHADFGKLEPVNEALRRVKRELAPETALIGFCGVFRREAQIEEAAGLGAQLAIFRQIAASLPHHPYRRHLLPAAGEHFDKRFHGGFL